MSKKYEILIVDDVSENIKVAISILQNENYNFSYALNGEQAIDILKTKRFDLLLLDVMMPGIDGFTLAKMIKKTPAIRDTPVIFLTAKVDIDSIEKGFSIGAVDYVTKPFHPIELKSRVANHLELYRYRRELKRDNVKLSNEIGTVKNRHYTDLELAQKEIIYMLSEIMESDSGETACHVKRVAHISQELGRLEGHLSAHDVEVLHLAAPLHDIGKILVDNSILHKAGSLDENEFEHMKEHTAYAIKILKNSQREIIKAARIIAYEHHEHFDGNGYPRGIRGETIHIFSRIVAIADVLDALTHKRAYKEAWSFEKAAKYIIDLKGTQFDPRLIEVFKTHLEVFKEIIEEDTECHS